MQIAFMLSLLKDLELGMNSSGFVISLSFTTRQFLFAFTSNKITVIIRNTPGVAMSVLI